MDKAIGYIRVSTRMQQDDGLSLEAQLDKIRTYCKLRDLEFIGYEKDSISGKNVKDRPGIKKVIKMAQDNQIDHIIVLRYERAFRNALETLKYIEEFAKLNVGFHSIIEQLDTTSPMGKLFLTIIAGFNEFEAKKIGERTKEIIEFKKTNGQRYSRFTTFGTKVGQQGQSENGKRVTMTTTDNKEVEAIKLAQVLRLKKYPLREIASKLEERGYLSRTNKPYNPSSIKKMLEKEFPWDEAILKNQ